MGGDGEMDTFLVLVGYVGGYAVAKINLAVGEVGVLGVAEVRQDVTFETEPVAIELGISLSTFGEIARLCDFVLRVDRVSFGAANSATQYLARGRGQTYGFLGKIGIECNVARRDVHVALEEDIL